MFETEWLASLKEGDPVLISRAGWNRGSFTFAKVDRLTQTQIVIGKARYRRKDGRLVGGSAWDGSWLVSPTPERLESMERRQLRDRLNGVGWDECTLETLRAVAAALDAAKEGNADG